MSSADQTTITTDVVTPAPGQPIVDPVPAPAPAAPQETPAVETTTTTTGDVQQTDVAPVKEPRKTKSGGGGKCFEKASVMALVKAINEDRIAKFMREQWPSRAIKYVDTFAKDEKNKDLSEEEKKAALDVFLDEKKEKDIEAIKYRLSADVHGVIEKWVSDNLSRLEKINYFEIPASYPHLRLKKVYFHRPEFKNFRRFRVDKIKANTERVIRYALLCATYFTCQYKKITIGKTAVSLVLGIITNIVFHTEPPAVVQEVAAPVELMDTAPKKSAVDQPKKATKKKPAAKKQKTAPAPSGEAVLAAPAKKAKPKKTAGKKAASKGSAAKKQKSSPAKKKSSKAVTVY